ncbi:MAG: DNA-formamidopyrimidine glycosylase family protein, partial [Terriglobales bacterium]
MPELPEVETVARGLQKRVAGDVIESVWISGKKQPLKSSPEEIVAALEGSRIVQARRVGKHIAIDLERASEVEGTPAARTGVSAVQTHQWIVHLGMTGSMLVTSPDAPIEKHTHLIAKMQSGKEVRFVDPRMFGKLAVTQEQFKAPGSEPLDI